MQSKFNIKRINVIDCTDSKGENSHNHDGRCKTYSIKFNIYSCSKLSANYKLKVAYYKAIVIRPLVSVLAQKIGINKLDEESQVLPTHMWLLSTKGTYGTVGRCDLFAKWFSLIWGKESESLLLPSIILKNSFQMDRKSEFCERQHRTKRLQRKT